MHRSECRDSEAWSGCYRSGYDLWTAESMAHPAKGAPGLFYRIFAHLKELGLLQPGDAVLDPMAGTGTTLLCAASLGHPAVGIELEPKFVGFATANLERLGKRMAIPPWQVIQGDSRKLAELVSGQYRAIMSPPFVGQNASQRKMDSTRAQVGKSGLDDPYGTSPGQIGSLKDRPLKVVTSPPYSDPRSSAGTLGQDDYDISRGQEQGKGAYRGRYGEADGQLGDETGTSYLDAMRVVYAQIALVADVLAVVTKNPTRAGQLRRLDLDTEALLIECGWTVVCHHKAMLFEENEQAMMGGGSVKQPKGRMSFFKRLSYAKGSPVAAWEDILFAVREGEPGMKCVVSPPYQDAINSGKGGIDMHRTKDFRPDKWPENEPPQSTQGIQEQRYGTSPGQIGALK